MSQCLNESTDVTKSARSSVFDQYSVVNDIKLY